MALQFLHYRPSGNSEYPVTICRISTDLSSAIITNELPVMSVYRHTESSEINSIKTEIIDNKPLYIPLGRTGPIYKIQFRTFSIREYAAWYTVLGNDILKVLVSDDTEFPINSFWAVESITDRELPGSAFTVSSVVGHQPIIFEYELELSLSLKDSANQSRPEFLGDI